jgi:K+-sensing histidine kinase KdpD
MRHHAMIERSHPVLYVKTAATVGILLGILRLESTYVNGRTATAALLLSVLVSGRLWGTGPALFGAFAATVAYLYFFIPPLGFAVQDGNNWITLLIFFVTAVVGGSLLAQVQRSEERRKYFETLYWDLYNRQAADSHREDAPAQRL